MALPEHHVHRNAIVDEVGEPKDQIVVQNVEALVEHAPVTARQHVGPAVARQHGKRARRQLVANVVDAVVAQAVPAADLAAGAAGAQEMLQRVEDQREEDDAGRQFGEAGPEAGLVRPGIEHDGGGLG